MKKFLLIIISLFILCAAAGCGGSEKTAPAEKTSGGITVTDDNGREVALNGVPQKIVPLSASFFAKVAARVSAKAGILDEYKNLPEVGNVYNINIEKVIEQQPDLVIAYKGMNDKFVRNFEENGIPVVVLEMRTYAQVKNTVSVLGKICGSEDKAKQLNEAMDKRIADIKAKMPDKKLRIAILHSTAQNVTVQLEGSIAGSTAELLGFDNIAAGSVPLENNPTAAPYSMETLVAADPGIIYITSMGKLETIKAAMQKSIEQSPAWQSLPAVKAGRVYYLPQEMFLLSPGVHYPEAVEYMAELAYPDSFK